MDDLYILGCLAVGAWLSSTFGIIGSGIAKRNGRSGIEGLAWGFLLGPIGLIIVSLQRPGTDSRNVKRKGGT